MKFDKEIQQVVYYNNYNLPENRKSLLDSEDIKSVKSTLFDLFDIEEIFLTEEFLTKNIIDPKVSIFTKMKEKHFIEFLDKRDQILSDSLTVICEVENIFYRVTHDEVKECKRPEFLLEVLNEQNY